ncbi:hypothetical protein T10_9448 [Trichinella papuae]|uniref:Uncharacterized protein n=1 Tax=Trichinella papuae TaxID=268474 RepID=A0A0V1MXN9_9BILA|nr:hypothetical protein T10_9448 [Trichinella papuae]
MFTPVGQQVEAILIGQSCGRSSIGCGAFVVGKTSRVQRYLKTDILNFKGSIQIRSAKCDIVVFYLIKQL